MSSSQDITRFVIIFMGRTGSSYLIQSLNNHPNIFALDEVLGIMVLKEGTGEDVQARQKKWLQEFYTEQYEKPVTTIGFKTKYTDILDLKHFEDMLYSYGIKTLFLGRKNLIKLALSQINSRRIFNKHEKDYNILSTAEKPGPVEIDPAYFDQILQRRVKFEKESQAWFDSLKTEKLTLYYEELFGQTTETHRRIFDFLGLPYTETKGMYVKATSDDLREAIINYDELKARYRGTEYEEMF